ncbi:MAG: hypothetical protein RLZZ210_1377 [Pseudomonadota bacterium]|jgi:hypothetical protein
MIKANNREYSLISRGLRPDPIDWTDMLTEEEKKALNLKEPTHKKRNQILQLGVLKI